MGPMVDLDCEETKVIQVTVGHEAFQVSKVRKVIEDILDYLARLVWREKLEISEYLAALVIIHEIHVISEKMYAMLNEYK